MNDLFFFFFLVVVVCGLSSMWNWVLVFGWLQEKGGVLVVG